MKVLVISDSHYSDRMIVKAFEKERPDVICFLGDGLKGFLEFRDYEMPGGVDTYLVTGNCDHEYEGEYALSQAPLIGGVRMFMTHGHRFGVNHSLSDLCSEAYTENCGMALYGHTHLQKLSSYHGVTALNPGALVNGGYAVINIIGGKTDIKLLSL